IVPKIYTNWRLRGAKGSRRSWCGVGISRSGIRPAMGKAAADEGLRRVAGEVRILPIAVAEEILAGVSLTDFLLTAARKAGMQFQDGDILVVKHKIISKAEGAMIALHEVHPSAASLRWERRYGQIGRAH